MNLEEFINCLDFESYDYFYHVTESGSGKSISEEGLYVDGNNILDVDNIIYTTAIPFIEDYAKNESELLKFLTEELRSHMIRNTDNLVIIGSPKEYNKLIVSSYNDYKDGTYYEGVIEPDYIMGYFDKDSLTFCPNEFYNFYDCEIFSDALTR